MRAPLVMVIMLMTTNKQTGLVHARFDEDVAKSVACHGPQGSALPMLGMRNRANPSRGGRRGGGGYGNHVGVSCCVEAEDKIGQRFSLLM